MDTTISFLPFARSCGATNALSGFSTGGWAESVGGGVAIRVGVSEGNSVGEGVAVGVKVVVGRGVGVAVGKGVGDGVALKVKVAVDRGGLVGLSNTA